MHSLNLNLKSGADDSDNQLQLNYFEFVLGGWQFAIGRNFAGSCYLLK